MTSMAMTMFIALSFSASAQTDRVVVTNNTACDMTVAIIGSSQLSPCSNDYGEGTAVVPANSTATVFFYEKGIAVTTFFTGAGAMETDNNGVPQGLGASHDQCTTTLIPGSGPTCSSFYVTITGQASMTIN